MPTYNTYLNALDELIRSNNGDIPDLNRPYTGSIVGKEPSEHTGLTVGDILRGAFAEITVLRPSFDEVHALEGFYNPNAPLGIQKPLKDYVDRLKALAVVRR